MRALVLGVFAAVLGACTPSVRDISIADLNLADGKTLASLQEALPADDRAALGTYALLHWPKSKFYCGQPIGGRSAPASTVGEAIAETRAYEAQLAIAQASAPKGPAPVIQAEETALITEMEKLVLERDMLYGRIGPSADQTPRGAEIKRELAVMRAKIERLRDSAAS